MGKPKILKSIDTIKQHGFTDTAQKSTKESYKELENGRWYGELIDAPEEGGFFYNVFVGNDDNYKYVEAISWNSNKVYQNKNINSVWGEWKEIGSPIISGGGSQDGTIVRQIELRKGNTHIQWKYTDEEVWKNLIAIQELKGDKGERGETGLQGEQGVAGRDGVDGTNGKEIELQKTSTHIQWKYVDTEDWKNLIEISMLKGEQGERGEKGEQGEQGERGETGLQGEKGDTGVQGERGEKGEQGLQGEKGERGQDGREIELRKNEGFIQYKYSGEEEVSWKNIISIEELKGEKGDSADVSQFYTKGEVDGKVEGLSPKSHTHTKENISDFDHTHSKSEITDFTHEHTKSEISDFSHTHTKEDISDFPTSLPANGGNADTVGGKSQDFFAPKSNPTLDGKITVNGDIVLGTTKKLKWNAGREGESEIFWHADAGTDFGLIAKVDGQQQMILEKNKFPRFNINGQWKEIGGGSSGELKWGKCRLTGEILDGDSIYIGSYDVESLEGNLFELYEDFDYGHKFIIKEQGIMLCICTIDGLQLEYDNGSGLNILGTVYGDEVYTGTLKSNQKKMYRSTQFGIVNYDGDTSNEHDLTLRVEPIGSGAYSLDMSNATIFMLKLSDLK